MKSLILASLFALSANAVIACDSDKPEHSVSNTQHLSDEVVGASAKSCLSSFLPQPKRLLKMLKNDHCIPLGIETKAEAEAMAAAELAAKRKKMGIVN